MMKNKIIVKVIVPSIDKVYDVKIPVNEVCWKVNKLTTKAIFDLNTLEFNIKEDNFMFYNKNTGRIYQNNEVIIDTDIRNGTELILLREENIK